jgi:hypothetical protein
MRHWEPLVNTASDQPLPSAFRGRTDVRLEARSLMLLADRAGAHRTRERPPR